MKYIIEDYRVYLTNKDGAILAFVTFPKINDEEVIINHTYVDSSLRGKGIASKLLEEAYKKIKEQNLKAIPECSYAVKWFDDNFVKRDILKEYREDKRYDW